MYFEGLFDLPDVSNEIAKVEIIESISNEEVRFADDLYIQHARPFVRPALKCKLEQRTFSSGCAIKEPYQIFLALCTDCLYFSNT